MLPVATAGVGKKNFRKFRVVLVCFGLLRNSSVCFGCFDIGSKHRNKPKFFAFGFKNQIETNAKQILFRFFSVRTEIYFCLFRGHPSLINTALTRSTIFPNQVYPLAELSQDLQDMLSWPMAWGSTSS
jgi:hypothetical protein